MNPKLERVLGEPCVARLADLSAPVDLVNLFRAPAHLPGHVEEILALSPRPKGVWFQLGIRHEEAAARLSAAGIDVALGGGEAEPFEGFSEILFHADAAGVKNAEVVLAIGDAARGGLPEPFGCALVIRPFAAAIGIESLEIPCGNWSGAPHAA